ncbi:hypothetical protein [Tunturibacter empetritectus]|uniref:Lipoprotein n=1 Tax=Tunturiibacter lichenicola TaxID=2051959 RepID=A0A7W8J6C8_9BACT|nr:hypothetical protein [Edaphobacter lichenicola]MBB5343361.1 hypothetical protein [Edaphobacter lichenicola]
MHNRFRLVSIVGLLVLTACNDAKKPIDTNFTQAINEHLMKHGQVCTVMDRQFPIDVPRSEQDEQLGIGRKLEALKQATLVQATDTTSVVHGMLDSLRGSTPPQLVRRYQLTAEGQKYFRQIPGTLGQPRGFCYGQKTVDTIVKWTEPAALGSISQTEVTYTYKIANPAAWAERPDVQRAFPDIRENLNGGSKTTEQVGLQQTSRGWEAPGQ